MTINEYTSILEILMDSLLEKTYNNKLKWSSTVNSNSSITYKATILPEMITVICIIYENGCINIYIIIDNCCTKINSNICCNNNVEKKIYELKCILEEASHNTVIYKLKDLIV